MINKPNVIEGTHIQKGDEIRLCWNFNDQTAGWRDFVDDMYGRRRNDVPDNMEITTLYLFLREKRTESAKIALR